MAVRQYIGARYVPLYAGDWSATQTYEPLTIVTDANGNSFTSLKDVPAGTALTNREYWIQTSSFSAAVDALQRRMSSAEDSISDLDTRMGTAETGISDLDTRVGDVEQSISARVKRNAVVLGNSYAQGAGSVEGLYNAIKDLFDSSELHYGSGTGFLTYRGHNDTFGTLLGALPSSEDITDVVILSAVGERRALQEYVPNTYISAMNAAIVALESAANAKYPNLRNILVFHCSSVPVLHFTNGNTISGYEDYQGDFWVHNLYPNCVKGTNVQYCGWAAWDTFMDANAYQSDNVHPSASGNTIIASFIRAALQGLPVSYAKKNFVQYNVPMKVGASDTDVINCDWVTEIIPEFTYLKITTRAAQASTAEIVTPTGNVVATSGNSLDIAPPIGNYGGSGDLRSSYSQVVRMCAFVDATMCNETYTYETGVRTPSYGHNFQTAVTIPRASRANRFPAVTVYSNYPGATTI